MKKRIALILAVALVLALITGSIAYAKWGANTVDLDVVTAPGGMVTMQAFVTDPLNNPLPGVQVDFFCDPLPWIAPPIPFPVTFQGAVFTNALGYATLNLPAPFGPPGSQFTGGAVCPVLGPVSNIVQLVNQ